MYISFIPDQIITPSVFYNTDQQNNTLDSEHYGYYNSKINEFNGINKKQVLFDFWNLNTGKYTYNRQFLTKMYPTILILTLLGIRSYCSNKDQITIQNNIEFKNFKNANYKSLAKLYLNDIESLSGWGNYI